MEELLNNRVSIANLPTPVHHFPRLSEQFGINLFIKRDDLTESVASGNKLRKMEYVLYDAVKQSADTLATCGGIQSNHCRAVAWIAAKTGLNCILLLRGEKPQALLGNHLIDCLLGAETRFFSKDEFQNINEIGNQVCDELAEKGNKPYYIPMGASIATGSLGYVRMVKELMEDNQTFDHMYVALGSGGTLAGILLGCQYFKYPGKIHGIAVCDDIPYFTTELNRIQQEFETHYNISLDLSDSEQVMDDNYVGIGYALNTEDELRTLKKLAETEGLILDPVYTLKAFIGMIDHIQKGIIKPGEKVLFLHTGGHYGLFPKSDELGNVL
jgi:D-cysteine desulfhydrase